MLRGKLLSIASEAGPAAGAALAAGTCWMPEPDEKKGHRPAQVPTKASQVRKMSAAQAGAIAPYLSGEQAALLFPIDKRVVVRSALAANPFINEETADAIHSWSVEEFRRLSTVAERNLHRKMSFKRLVKVSNNQRNSKARGALIQRDLTRLNLSEMEVETRALLEYLVCKGLVADCERSDMDENTLIQFVRMLPETVVVPHHIVKQIIDKGYWDVLEFCKTMGRESMDDVAQAYISGNMPKLFTNITHNKAFRWHLRTVPPTKLADTVVYRIMEDLEDRPEDYCEYIDFLLDYTLPVRNRSSLGSIITNCLAAQRYDVCERVIGALQQNVEVALEDLIKANPSIVTAPRSLWAALVSVGGLHTAKVACELGPLDGEQEVVVQRVRHLVATISYLKNGEPWDWVLSNVNVGEHIIRLASQGARFEQWLNGSYPANKVDAEVIDTMIGRVEQLPGEALRSILNGITLSDESLLAVLKKATGNTPESIKNWLNGECKANAYNDDVVRSLYGEMWAAPESYFVSSTALLTSERGREVLRTSPTYLRLLRQVGTRDDEGAMSINTHLRFLWETLHETFGDDAAAWDQLGHHLDTWESSLDGLIKVTKAILR